ncbi:hypothetical protein D3C85_1876660 [compost metagenome]
MLEAFSVLEAKVRQQLYRQRFNGGIGRYLDEQAGLNQGQTGFSILLCFFKTDFPRDPLAQR